MKRRQDGFAAGLAPPGGRPPRVGAPAGAPPVVRLGMRVGFWEDGYHRALTMPWRGLLLLGAAVYLGANAVFAGLYLLDPGGIANARPGRFADAFFFSVQTLATIGYGVMAPRSLYVNLLVTAETLAGLLIAAIAAGLLFARFSRPTAQVRFSRVATIAPHDGVPTLTVRLANRRRSQILQADVSMVLVRNERTGEGLVMRRFHDLALARGRTPIFALTFSVMHRLDESSPLHGIGPAALSDGDFELLVTVTGLDEALSQVVHARHSYLGGELKWNHRFVDILGYMPDGRVAIDYRRFDETQPA